MEWQKGELIYEGKAKRVYSVQGSPDYCWLEYKDSLTAFNAQKKGSFEGKGLINSEIATLIFRFLKRRGIPSHWVAKVSPVEMVCERVKIIPLEVVIRNRIAGSTAKKLGWEEGREIPSPLVEFYLKDDALGDPFLSDDQALLVGAVQDRQTLDSLRQQALKINGALREMFSTIGLDLVDFKLEFGMNSKGNLLLADEISPDSCRLWDQQTGEKMDKDRFRRDLGRVEESYREVLQRLKTRWGDQL